MSEDLIRRSDAIKAIEELPNAYNGWSDAYDKAYIIGTLEEVPSADRPQEDTVSRRYLLAEIDDLADEFSELDENGLHGERWCGIMDSKGIIMNTPSVSDRPQGEWVGEADGYADGEFVYDTWYCSNCDYTIDDDEPPTWNFCPNCGARMKGADDE